MPSRVRSAAAQVSLLVLSGVMGCQQTPATQATSTTNELVGAWSLRAVDPGDGSAVIEPSQPGQFIFTDRHYSAVFSPARDVREKSVIAFQPTADEMVAQYQSIIVNAGTYEISGSTVTFRPIIAKSPGFVGGHQTSTFTLRGDTLILSAAAVVAADGVAAPNVGGSLTLVRIE